MDDPKPGLGAILRINIRFLMSALVLFYSGLLWHWASPLMWGFYPVAIIGAIGGAIEFFGALGQVIGWIRLRRRIVRFRRQGGAMRGDRMPSEEELRKRGLL